MKTKRILSFLCLLLAISTSVSIMAQGIDMDPIPLFPKEIKVSATKVSNFQNTLKKNKELVAFIENTLLQNGLPKMLRNLSLIESDFEKNAVSSANAGGIWQFTIDHARDFGLHRDKRFDIYHSTQVAVKSLKALYNKYHNWITVVAAYNCGPGNVDKAISKAKSTQYQFFYGYLPTETIKHVTRFMEACYATGELGYLTADYTASLFNPDNNNKNTREQKGPSPTLVSTPINAAFDVNIIADEMQLTQKQLGKWNPHLKAGLEKEGVALLYLPVDKMPDFILLKNKVLQRSLKTNTRYDASKL